MRKGQNFIDLTGERFGRLTVMKRSQRKAVQAMWDCACECGTEVTIRSQALRTGHTKSCGCWNRDYHREKLTSRNKTNATHRKSRTKVYKTWQSLRSRCLEPDRTSYFGKISVCDQWNSFENFYADMGDPPSSTHSIDRIDPNGDYSPENCRWATPTQQQRNKTSNVRITAFGKTRCVSEWSAETGIPWATLRYRIAAGWTNERALTQPIRPWPGRKGD